VTVSVLPKLEPEARLLSLRQRYSGLEGKTFLKSMIQEEFPGKIALVSSFGAEAAVLLHMVSEIDPTVPVLFLNTGKLFGETLRYRDRLQMKFGLTDVRAIGPHPADERELDGDGTLWRSDPDGCCHFRKVLPLRRALESFEVQITGRKRFQTDARAGLETIEADPQRGPGFLKINPLVNWTLDDLSAYIERHKLPKHPLVKDGFVSIGCMPCTERVRPGGDYREGRWAGTEKDECGIHLPENVDGDGI
jgi:phosphoadenosine phosphosulfate reductase